MVQSKQELYTLIADCMTWEGFEEQIRSQYKQYGELFDEDTIALLIVDELGRNTKSTLSISDLHPGLECSIIGTITSIEPLGTFKRKNGNIGRYVRLTIADDTGSSILILWNEDTSLVESKTITIGTTVKIINGYTKKGYHDVEIHIGQWSVIEPLTDLSGDKTKTTHTTQSVPESMICGRIRTIEPTRVFFKDDGTYGFVTTLSLRTSEGTKELTVWDDQVKHLQHFQIDDQISLSHVDVRTKDGVVEYHVNGKASIKKT